MAAYVCFRSCCRQTLHHFFRSGTKSPTFSNIDVFVAPPFNGLTTSLRLYHGLRLIPSNSQLAGQRITKTGHRQGVMLWRTLRSQFKSERRSLSDTSSPGLLGPFAFTVFICGSSFAGAMIWQYESIRSRAKKVIKSLEKQMGQIFEPAYQKEIGLRANINAWWNSMSDGKKMVLSIIALNFAVFLAWKSPNLHPFLMRYFACLPGNPSISMLLSAFSHFNLWHIAANMYVLWSFTSISINLFGKEQWLAVYLSADTYQSLWNIIVATATLSSLASLANKIFRRGSIAPSLGASGAIMCLLGAVCVTHPDARLSIAFVGELIPHSFSAGSALKFIVLLDTVGLVLGWRVFDHAAHLGGVLFGIWYATYGHKIVWGHREKVVNLWREVRGKT